VKIYPSDFELKLGFDQIRVKLENYCLGKLGVKEVEQVAFFSDAPSIKTLLQRCRELNKFLKKETRFLWPVISDPSAYFETIRIKESFLEEENFLEIIQALQAILSIHKLLKSSKEEYPELFKLTEQVVLPNQLVVSIEDKFNEKGKIKDNASPELARNKKTPARRRKFACANWQTRFFVIRLDKVGCPEGATITIREGRVVIPILAEHKESFVDLSWTNRPRPKPFTLSPLNRWKANNEIRDLLHADRREVVKILKELTSLLRDNLEGIRKGCQFLGLIDFNRAKA